MWSTDAAQLERLPTTPVGMFAVLLCRAAMCARSSRGTVYVTAIVKKNKKKVEVYWNYVCVTVAHQESNKKRL